MKNNRNFEVLISLPVRNEIKTLESCLDSLVLQTKQSLILVSDNYSSDGSSRILEQYANKYSNIKLIKPPKPLNLRSHLEYLENFIQNYFPDIPYRIELGGDDEYYDNYLIEKLISKIKTKHYKNSQLQTVVCPSILFDNILTSKKRKIKKFYFMNSRFFYIRLLSISIIPNRYSFFSVNLGLIPSPLKFEQNTLYSLAAKKICGNSQRCVLAEYIGTIELLRKARVQTISQTTLTKREHNRIGNEKFIDANNLLKIKNKNKIEIIKAQSRLFSQFLRACHHYRSELTAIDYLVMTILGIFSYLINWLDFAAVYVVKKFMKFKNKILKST